jgi:hypothetical protein
MPITPFLNGQKFDAETRRVLGVAFELVCVALRIENSDDQIQQYIANKLIELASDGERNPDMLCERALTLIRAEPALFVSGRVAASRSMEQASDVKGSGWSDV